MPQIKKLNKDTVVELKWRLSRALFKDLRKAPKRLQWIEGFDAAAKTVDKVLEDAMRTSE